MPMSILYYPLINIEDGAWLRKAILYGDSVSSIVPDEYHPNYPHEIEYLLQEGIYYPTYPSRLFSSAYKDMHLKFQLEVLKKLKPLKSSSGSMNRAKIQWPELGTMIHYGKLSSELYDDMLDSNLITVHDNDWLEMDAKAADLYMSTLAKYLANIADTYTVICTDRAPNLEKAFTRSYPNSSSFTFTICFQDALPAPNPDVPLPKFVAFRRKRTEELLQLRNKINDFEISISKSENLEELKGRLSNFRDEWTLAQCTYEKILKDDRIDYTFSSMKSLCTTSVPGILTAIGTTLGAPVPTWITVASLAAGGAIGIGSSYMKYRSDLRDLRDKSGFAYLYDASRKNLIKMNSSSIIV